MRSGSSSAHIPCASQAIGLTRTRRLIAPPCGGAASRRSPGAAAAAARAARAQASQGPWRAWSANSTWNVSSALRSTLTAPSGCPHAPRRRSARRAAACARRDGPARCPRAICSIVSASASSPCTQGPHWRVLCPASQRARRTVSGDRAGVLGEQQHDARAEARAVRGEVFVGERHRRAAARRRSSCPRSRRAAPRAGARSRRRRPRSARPARRRARSRRRPGGRRAPTASRAPSPAARRCRAPGTSAAPWRAISAMWASVSTLLTSVGRRPTPCSKGSGGVNVGLAGPPPR